MKFVTMEFSEITYVMVLDTPGTSEVLMSVYPRVTVYDASVLLFLYSEKPGNVLIVSCWNILSFPPTMLTTLKGGRSKNLT